MFQNFPFAQSSGLVKSFSLFSSMMHPIGTSSSPYHIEHRFHLRSPTGHKFTSLVHPLATGSFLNDFCSYPFQSRYGRFEINLKNAQDDAIFHFNARLDERLVVLNSGKDHRSVPFDRPFSSKI